MMQLFPERRCYRAFGLNLHTRYPLPAEHVAPGFASPDDVTIDFTPIDAPRASPEHISRRRLWDRDASGARLRFLDSSGYDLEVRFDRTASNLDVRFSRPEEDVSCILLGAAMGALLHLRGTPALHATTVALDGRAIAIAGTPSAGKSSLALALVAGGLAFVSDDLTPLRLAGGAGTAPSAPPGGRALRLCRELAVRARELFGVEPGAAGTDGKFPVDVAALRGGFESRHLPLAAIWLLAGRRLELERPLHRRLEPSEACLTLTRLVYGRAWLSPSDRDVLAYCARLAGSVPVYEAWLPDGLDRINATAAAIRQLVARSGDAAP